MRPAHVRHVSILGEDETGLLTHGLLCDRRPWLWIDLDRPIGESVGVNVKQTLFPYGDCGMDWQPCGPRQWTLALNVLDAYLPARLNETSEVDGVHLPCSAEAALFHRGFATEILSHVPYWGGQVGSQSIRQWIEDAQQHIARHGIDLGDLTP